MKVIAYEHRTTTFPGTYINYYAVAVVKKNSSLTMATLKVSINGFILQTSTVSMDNSLPQAERLAVKSK